MQTKKLNLMTRAPCNESKSLSTKRHLEREEPSCLTMIKPQAEEWTTSIWFNTETALSLAKLKGRVIVMHAFQMLCPACVSHSMPQAKRLHEVFADTDLAVIGLHTVFEHHEAMESQVLKAFISENKLLFPIGVDMASHEGSIPQTMRRYQFQGTPSIVLIDRHGKIRLQNFGVLDDMFLAKTITKLLLEDEITTSNEK